MESSSGNSDVYRSSSSRTSNHSRRHGVQISASTILRSPLSTLLEYTGILITRSDNSETDTLLNNGAHIGYCDYQIQPHSNDSASSPVANSSGGAGEVSIRIISASDHEHNRGAASMLHMVPSVGQLNTQIESFSWPISRSGSSVSALSSSGSDVDLRSDREAGDGTTHSANAGADTDAAWGSSNNNRDSLSSY